MFHFYMETTQFESYFTLHYSEYAEMDKTFNFSQ